MQKQVLIFGLWFQWSKYVSYFKDKWYNIFWVSKTGSSQILPSSQTLPYHQIKEYSKDFFESFNYIIIAVEPVSNQTEVISHLLEINTKILIEKPFTHDNDLLKIMIQKNNIYFCIDELYLYSHFNKIKIKDISLHASSQEMWEHAIANILPASDYNGLSISYTLTLREDWSDYYKILLWKYTWEFKQGVIYINDHKFTSVSFLRSLDYICSMSIQDSTLIKKNFYHFRQRVIHENTK